MSLSLSSSITCMPPFLDTKEVLACRSSRVVACWCKLPGSESLGGEEGGLLLKLSIGSPIIITEAPTMIKTAASVPCLRVNSGLLNPGDVGRIVSRKPMNVWAVRLSIGTYLIDEKYFKPLQLDEE